MDDLLREILTTSRTIAIVGLSPRPSRPSYGVAAYLQRHGYEIIGVNPTCAGEEILGVPVVATLAEIDRPIDLVDVFRRPAFTPEVAHDAVQVGARALWLQLGISNPDARRIAEAAGLLYVEDRCLKIEHTRLMGGSTGQADSAMAKT